MQSNNIKLMAPQNIFIAGLLYSIACIVEVLLLLCPPLWVLLLTDGGHAYWAHTLDHLKWARLDSCIGLSECFWEAVCSGEKTRENDKQR